MQALLAKVDETWAGLLKTLAAAADAPPAGADVAAGDGDGDGDLFVSTEAWMARASALALCARDSGASSDEAISRCARRLCFGGGHPAAVVGGHRLVVGFFLGHWGSVAGLPFVFGPRAPNPVPVLAGGGRAKAGYFLPVNFAAPPLCCGVVGAAASLSASPACVYVDEDGDRRCFLEIRGRFSWLLASSSSRNIGIFPCGYLFGTACYWPARLVGKASRARASSYPDQTTSSASDML